MVCPKIIKLSKARIETAGSCQAGERIVLVLWHRSQGVDRVRVRYLVETVSIRSCSALDSC